MDKQQRAWRYESHIIDLEFQIEALTSEEWRESDPAPEMTAEVLREMRALIQTLSKVADAHRT